MSQGEHNTLSAAEVRYIAGVTQRGSRAACGSRASLVRLTQDTFSNVRVLKIKYFVS
jgi:hypothetical protein